MSRRQLYLIAALLPLLLVAGAAVAQTAPTEANTKVNGLMDMIVAASNGWTTALRGYAFSLLINLGVIQLVLTFMPLVFKGADLGETLGEVVKIVLMIGFFAALIQYSPDWSMAIINSFRQAGAAAAGMGTNYELQPGDMFQQAVQFAETITNSNTLGHAIFGGGGFGGAILLSIAACVVLLCFAFIAAFMFVTLVEAFFIINTSVFFFGFGALTWTRDYAIAPLRYAVAMGAKLMAVTLLVGLILSVAKQWEAAYTAENSSASLFTLMGLALVCAYLTKSVADLVYGMISGTSAGGGHAIGGMIAAGAAAGVAAGSAAATVATAGAAAPVAGAATSAAAGGAATAGGGLAASLGASMAGGAGATGIGAGAAGLGATGAAAGGSGFGSAAITAARVGGNGLGAARGISAGAGTAGTGAGAAGSGATTGGSGLANLKAAHTTAAIGVKMAGTMMAITTPGAEGAAGLSVGSAPSDAVKDGENPLPDSGAPAGSESASENTIRPADKAPAPPIPLASLRVPGMADHGPHPEGGAA